MNGASQKGDKVYFSRAIFAALLVLTFVPWIWIYMSESDLQRDNLLDYAHATMLAWKPSARITTYLYVKQNSKGEQDPLTSDEVVVRKEMDPQPDGLPFELTPETQKRGWKKIVPGKELDYQCAELIGRLRAEIYGGKSLWRLLLKPEEVCILIFSCLYGCFVAYRKRALIAVRMRDYSRKRSEEQRRKEREQSPSRDAYLACNPIQIAPGSQHILPPPERKNEVPERPFVWDRSMWKDD